MCSLDMSRPSLTKTQVLVSLGEANPRPPLDAPRGKATPEQARSAKKAPPKEAKRPTAEGALRPTPEEAGGSTPEEAQRTVPDKVVVKSAHESRRHRPCGHHAST